MCVLGAIFLERPVVQKLTDSLWVGKDSAQPSNPDHFARVFDCISHARNELENYYRTNVPPPRDKNTGRPFPYLTRYRDSTGQIAEFAYRKSLCPGNREKAIFLAETIDKENPKPIVVKFVQSYNADAHRLLAEEKLAPELLYDGTMYPDDQPGPEHIMIVMELAQGEDLESLGGTRLPRSVFDDIKKAVDLLHSHNLVFGDLREPNVMVLQDSAGDVIGGAMLIDFDLCGKHDKGRYPLAMKMRHGWHDNVELGGVMRKEHDIHMLDKLEGELMFSS